MAKDGLTASSRTAPATLSRAELEEQLDGDEVSAKQLAIPHVGKSIKTLVRLQKYTVTVREKERGMKPSPPSVQRQAAKDLIDIAHGRPETRHPDDKTAGAGLTVIINQLTTPESQVERVVSAVDMAISVQDAVESTGTVDLVPSEAEGEPDGEAH